MYFVGILFIKFIKMIVGHLLKFAFLNLISTDKTKTNFLQKVIKLKGISKKLST